jgi:2'-5' RNA ligase
MAMRLFIAIRFDETTEKKALELQRQIQDNASKGSYTAQGNLHVTLSFLGEVEASLVPRIQREMETIEHTSFSLQFNQLGYFEKKLGDIWWIGCRREPALLDLESILVKRLSLIGLPGGEEPYHPHLTLARNVKMDPAYKAKLLKRHFSPFTVQVSGFTLTHSPRVDSLLTYSPLYYRAFANR